MRPYFWFQTPFKRIGLTIYPGMVVFFLLRRKLRKAKWFVLERGFYPRAMYDLKKIISLLLLWQLLRTWPQKCFLSYHSSPFLLFLPVSATHPHESHPLISKRYLGSVYLLSLLKRNMHLVLLMHIDRIYRQNTTVPEEDGRPLPQLHPAAADFLACFLSLWGAALRGVPISRFWGLAISVFLNTCVWCICVVWMC